MEDVLLGDFSPKRGHSKLKGLCQDPEETKTYANSPLQRQVWCTASAGQRSPIQNGWTMLPHPLGRSILQRSFPLLHRPTPTSPTASPWLYPKMDDSSLCPQQTQHWIQKNQNRKLLHPLLSPHWRAATKNAQRHCPSMVPQGPGKPPVQVAKMVPWLGPRGGKDFWGGGKGAGRVMVVVLQPEEACHLSGFNSKCTTAVLQVRLKD